LPRLQTEDDIHLFLNCREEVHSGFWQGTLRGKDHLEDPGVDGRIILRWIFRKWDGGMEWIDLAQDRKGVAGTCKCGNEPSGSIKSREFLD
jgi:hypothetical protein